MTPKDRKRYPTLLEQMEARRTRPVCQYCGLVNAAPPEEWNRDHPSCARVAELKGDKNGKT